MTRPGVEIVTLDTPTPSAVPTDTSVFFVVGVTKTQAPPQLVRSLNEYEAVYGVRDVASAAVADTVECFFNEGGSSCWVSPAATADAAGVEAALDALGKDLGPGQVAAPGLTDAATQVAVLAHAAAANRVALLDTELDGDQAALLAQAAALAADENASYGGLFGPTVQIPGLAAGTTRQVGWAGIEAGIIARNDRTQNADVAAAGDNGRSSFALALDGAFTDQEYEDLNAAGVCMARNRFGAIECYGFRSLSPDPDWAQFSWARMRMAIAAECEAIGETYVFSQIDGRGKTLSRFAGDLSAMLAGFYNDGALYGDTAQDAFQVNTDSPINTDQTAADGELHAQLLVRMSPFSELVVIEIVKVAITQALAAA